MNKAIQLVKVLNNTNDQELNNKFNNYFSTHLKNLSDLLHDIQTVSPIFKFDILYTNDCKVWNPIEDLQAYAANYNIKDKYIYKNYFGFYSSCNTLKDYYTQPTIARIARKLAYLFKQDQNSKKLLTSLKPSGQDLLINILNNC